MKFKYRKRVINKQRAKVLWVYSELELFDQGYH